MKRGLKLPKRYWFLEEELREELRKLLEPIVDESELVSKIKDAKKIITVGDLSTLTVYKRGITPDLAIVDYKTKRSISKNLKKSISSIKVASVKKVVNPPGKLTLKLWNAIKNALEEEASARIEVDGEEDLAALSAIYHSSEDSVVLYGIPNKGITVVPANKKNKDAVKKILLKMRIV